MSTYEIPLSPTPQQFNIALAGVNYQLRVHWCDAAQVWVLDVASNEGNLLVGGIPLVTGADLLAQYPYLTFGGALVAQTDFDLAAPPNFTNLGILGHLYFVTTP